MTDQKTDEFRCVVALLWMANDFKGDASTYYSLLDTVERVSSKFGIDPAPLASYVSEILTPDTPA